MVPATLRAKVQSTNLLIGGVIVLKKSGIEKAEGKPGVSMVCRIKMLDVSKDSAKYWSAEILSGQVIRVYIGALVPIIICHIYLFLGGALF